MQLSNEHLSEFHISEISDLMVMVHAVEDGRNHRKHIC